MNILIPMAGAGQRFVDAGYKIHKPAIQTFDLKSGELLPMVVCATKDLPGTEEDGRNIIYIDRTFHRSDGVEEEIKNHYPKATFITIDLLTDGQAATCLLAKERINNNEELLIAGCDNGMIFDLDKFYEAKQTADVLVFTYRNNECVLENPNAYGWVEVDSEDNITGVSIKKSISDCPMRDHAIVATFWFKHGSIFVQSDEEMIAKNDRVNGEFYVDQTIQYVIQNGFQAKVFEIDRYIGWGTPKDFELYSNTIHYWKDFIHKNKRSFIKENTHD